ncbi:restriction endonuclease [Staphylococcus haemolyticus]|uniref:restriction endonuclease n=1 Tax=Staphylococcus TaxID=1279 RepID=UPI000AE1B340|nr:MULTISPECIES: restriction endonuclease [Staphylococcus]MCH4374671.1 restriction endonuclease [Staphylococcus haemolyticus]MCH4405358.1 restriction endonuclease [Staphylococcus haemolyticus]MCH4433093.1 restriction endonuclease [Staphylococcus haemolyticus]MCH4522422.1 restriction endonuclease [Staphylococcus haemolyticus]MEB7320632.1 restriction endonuclease [Staphylococcus haemolyticus]
MKNSNLNYINSFKNIDLDEANIHESAIRKYMPEILDLLLIDRTKSTIKKSTNIIWANENYIHLGKSAFSPTSQIKTELITGNMENIIMPRALKTIELQKKRTKTKGEVFTPPWLIKKQNDEIDKNYKNDNIEEYINRTWLEITCGEGPYMTTRYDMETGQIIPIKYRAGFIDRKLKKINANIKNRLEWQNLVIKAYKSSYGFEWNGDSLLLARENSLYTFRDFYISKWHEEPSYELFLKIAEIISYNIFQMDGLKYIIPLSDQVKSFNQLKMTLFDDEVPPVNKKLKQGIKVKIMNWETNKLEYFDKGVK